MSRRRSGFRARESGLDLCALGTRVRELRISRNLLQKELGAFLGVSYQWIMRLEQGTVPPPPIDLLKLLGLRLGVSVGVLIGEGSAHEGSPAVEEADEVAEPASLGTRIAELRRQARWSQGELALRLGIPRLSLIRYESDLQVPGTRRVIGMARVLGVSLDRLLLGVSDLKEDAPLAPFGSE